MAAQPVQMQDDMANSDLPESVAQVEAGAGVCRPLLHSLCSRHRYIRPNYQHTSVCEWRQNHARGCTYSCARTVLRAAMDSGSALASVSHLLLRRSGGAAVQAQPAQPHAAVVGVSTPAVGCHMLFYRHQQHDQVVLLLCCNRLAVSTAVCTGVGPSDNVEGWAYLQ